ncbi:N-carbamoyl-D-amino acid hydrolase [Stieleria maiorica]|uniref:N-carbamoyl-D-amino acid hydrolase n=1 Tax=Stieleria maiorica TaxID=2795974 RepID=A0A5B9MDK9_9BACT|nr:carbon-nitrogen hydrolase [Stieleria maiorica]QEF99342.1 N-carbamoyl-D-amino acid hydrolase [Stieleria maiorica]
MNESVPRRSVRIGLLQMSYAGSLDQMLDEVEKRVDEAASESVQIVCLQELFATPYPCQEEDHCNFDFAETLEGPSVRRMQTLAKRHEMVIVAPIFERRAAGVYHNTAVVIDWDGSIAGTYRKMHIPDDPLYYEKFYFTPGDLGFRTIQTRYAKLGVGVCWDQWFPEAARLFALAGAEILFYPTAIGWIDGEKEEFGAGQLDAWQTSMRAHAIANGLWLGAPNRVGKEGQVEFWGSSFVVSPRGEVVAQGGDSDEQVLCVDCNLDEIDVVRTHWPFLRDRRIDAYEGLCKRLID